MIPSDKWLNNSYNIELIFKIVTEWLLLDIEKYWKHISSLKSILSNANEWTFWNFKCRKYQGGYTQTC